MGKKRNANKKSYRAAEGSATSSIHGGGGCNSSKFSVFEFNVDDTRAEGESRKAVAKFGAKSPIKKPVHSRESMDKYVFLASFAKGTTDKQKHFGNDVLGVDATGGVSHHGTYGIDAGMTFGSLNYELKPFSCLECQSSPHTCGAKSSLAMSNSGCCTTGKNHNNILHLDSDEDERLEREPLNEGSLEVEVIVRGDPGRSIKQEEVKSLNISEFSPEDSFEEVVYPDGDPDAVFISRRDIELLQPETFINDTIVDFYIKYLVNKTKAEERCRFHFFNSFFFQKLVAVKRDLSRDCGEKDVFQSVCKWTRNVDIFEKDFIFIPVNFSLHWSLIIICHSGEVANLRNKNMDNSSEVPCILHLDSIRGSHRGLENLIRSYLWEEWRERGNEQNEDISKKFLNLDFVSPQIPQQENLFDCGLFLLHYAELFLKLVSNCRTIKYTDILNRQWFHPAEVSLNKRDHIRKLIIRVIQDNALKDPLAGNDNYFPEVGTSMVESSAKSIPKNSGNESSSGIYFNAVEVSDSMGQDCFEPMLNQRNICKSASKECCQHCKMPVSINQFKDLSSPEEISSLQVGEISSRARASETCSDEFVAEVVEEEDEEDHSPEATERQVAGNQNSSMSCEYLVYCVVEDSEDEAEVQSIRRRRVFLD